MFHKLAPFSLETARRAAEALGEEKTNTPTVNDFVNKCRWIQGSDAATDQRLASAVCEEEGHALGLDAGYILHEAGRNRGMVAARCARCGDEREYAAERLWDANDYAATNGPLPQALHSKTGGGRQDHLALDRTKLANHRTFLAYTRTMIMLFASGITFLKAFPDDNVMRVLGWILIPAAVVVLIVGITYFCITNYTVKRRYSDVDDQSV